MVRWFGSTNSRITTSGLSANGVPVQQEQDRQLTPWRPSFGNILGQVTRTIDARFMMDRKRIFHRNLAKRGKLGEDKSNLLGRFGFRVSPGSHGRADLPESGGGFSTLVDEFQSFATDSFASIFPKRENTVFRLRCLTSTRINCRTRSKVRYSRKRRVAGVLSGGTNGRRDPEREFGRVSRRRRFTPSSRITCTCSFDPLSDGAQVDPFHGKTLEPAGRKWGRRETIIRRNRGEVCPQSEREVDGRIRRWLGEYPP